MNTHLLEKENFNLELLKVYQNTSKQNASILSIILENTKNTYYKTYTMRYFL